MFDVSFSELVVIALVALIVIGPEKLPKVARTAGAIVGRMRRYMDTIKEEVNREARFAELQKLQEEIKQSANNLNQKIIQTSNELSNHMPGINSYASDEAASKMQTKAKISKSTVKSKVTPIKKTNKKALETKASETSAEQLT